MADTPEAEIYTERVALTNLARRRGIEPTFKDDKYLPEELLIPVEKYGSFGPFHSHFVF